MSHAVDLLLVLSCAGTETLPLSNYWSIDVRDVATAHILAFEVPSASGRYCLVSNVTHAYEVLKIIQELYPTLHLPGKCEVGSTLELKYQVSAAKGLGINFLPLEATPRDTIESLKEKGFLKI
ncbi:hypothetical protein DVH24_006616 [Malus domestica]|uniref:Uncharacterized protein n=1 Tax=Malus domestica TaxID=3750 RepID=A0A498KAW9_MALDO|nr:hypothetical protein DVH24_006616 [Malus domestica]